MKIIDNTSLLLGDELKEGVPPRVVRVMEDLFADLF